MRSTDLWMKSEEVDSKVPESEGISHLGPKESGICECGCPR